MSNINQLDNGQRMAVLKLGTCDDVHVLDHRPTLEEAQELVGGYVEIFERDGGKQFLVNEEGMYKGMGYNVRGTNLAREHYPDYAEWINFLGPVVILDGDSKWT